MPSSPWTSVVRGESEAAPPAASSPTAAAATAAAESESVALVSSPSSSSVAVGDDYSSDGGNGSSGSGCGSNGNAVTRPAWNKPSNGVVEVGPVMGAESWPALSKSARASGKSSQDSPKGSSAGSSSVSVPQIAGSASSTSQKQNTHNTNPSFTQNHTMQRHRSFKHNGGNSTSNGGTSQPAGSKPQTGDMHSNNSSPRDHGHRNAQSRNPNDQPQQHRNSFKRNGGQHSRDGSHHHSYGRRDHDRTNQEWNGHRNFNGRDARMQPQRGVPGFMRQPPPAPTQFLGPLPGGAYVNPIVHELPPVHFPPGPPPDPFRAVPFGPPIPYPFYYLPPDIQLHSKIVNQIDYYFSNENLIKDTFLRRNMDDQGFVPVNLIAGFKKVSQLTDNIQLILDCIRSSAVVEVQGDKVRRRHDWMRWTLPPAVQFPNATGAPSGVGQPNDTLVAGVQSISLEDNANTQSGGSSQTDARNDEYKEFHQLHQEI